MSAERTELIMTAMAQFASATRLYALTIGDYRTEFDAGTMMVEAFASDDALQDVGGRDVIAVSTNAHIALDTLLGQLATLEISLVDGTRTGFSGYISEAAMLGSNGGLARYRFRLAPWLWCLSQSRNSRVWQDKSVMEIVESVFESYIPIAVWRWSDETGPFMDGALPRSYCCQYRESDLDFVTRLLTEEGVAWRFEQTEKGPGVVLFSDSSQQSATPEDPSSKCAGGIRFHSARAVEVQDTVQSLQSHFTISASLETVLSYDYKSKRSVTASSHSRLEDSGRMPILESFDVPGQYAYASAALAQRYADLQMQGREARARMWGGRSTLRTLRAGARILLLDAPLERLGEKPAFVMLRVVSVGINNLPMPAQYALAELFGPIPELLEKIVRADLPDGFLLAIEQARKSGYANCFKAVLADATWRPELPGSAGRSRVHATSPGSQTAIVVGADGGDHPRGADELYCDRMGRVRIRFQWQDNNASCWVRVAQRAAGGGMGFQFLPRIGQEVMVKFLEGNIDRPVIVGAMYNGQGEGGVVPTPGGQIDRESQSALFTSANDHSVSAQGNIAAGKSPVWHGSSPESVGHRNSVAQSGFRSKEFGGYGYNQLLFDDTDAQGRIQLKSSYAGTELNLGHLIHSADNYRGSFRGTGSELRTDSYGAMRAGAGLLLSTYSLDQGALHRDPAADNAPTIALLKQAVLLGKSFSTAASTHVGVPFATAIGAQKASSSFINDKAAPLQAMLDTVCGMVGSNGVDSAKADAVDRNTSPDRGKVPHASRPVIAIAAKAGLGVSARKNFQLVNGETVSLIAGQDSQFTTGGQMRLHSGQTIGLLGGALKSSVGGIGLQFVAAKDATVLQALRDVVTIQARDDVNVITVNSHIDWAAAKTISLSTAGGANITIDAGNITVQCPGKITVRAGKKSFIGPQNFDYPLPRLPREVCIECLLKALKAGSALSLK